MKKVYTFIDNSNLFIEGKRFAKVEYVYEPEQLFRFRIDYGNMLELVKGDRTLEAAVLVGSRPPQKDTLWNKFKSLGLQPRIFDRSQFTGREKGVDAELINSVRDVIDDAPEKGIISLVAGDSDYLSTMERCVKKGWEVEIYFWSNASSRLKRLSGTRFIELDKFFQKITFQTPERLEDGDRIAEPAVI